MQEELFDGKTKMGPTAAHMLLKVKNILDGIVFLVLPQTWATRSGLVVKSLFKNEFRELYDDSIVDELVPLLQTIAVYDVYENKVDEVILDVMQYFEDYM